ncbi:2OG-Fe(II) oxygenase [Novilysobacter arseniciresistens]|uniref:2OG-Fe(II) oxygenase n=1 Tax=Novilysobacter arseniciresistens TaxID=1385522 RepID=UPI00126A1B48|nr:2OG-Fe(II) oxygenase [Lysobacter arseniciresistens]
MTPVAALAAIPDCPVDAAPAERHDADDRQPMRALFRKAAQGGHTGAQVAYARMLLFGLGGAPERRQALGWLQRAEAAGNCVAGYWLAWLALGSVLLPRDGRINQRMLAAVHHGHPPALRAAAVHMGRKRDPADQRLCVHLLERAATGGDLLSALLLAERLERGEGCEPRPMAAAAWRTRLVDAGAPVLPVIDAPPPAPRPARGPCSRGTLAFEEALVPPPLQWLSEHPRLAQIDGLLTSDECRLLVAHALLDGHGDALHPAWRVQPASEDFALRVLQLRLARAARSELAHAEPLQVECRRPGPIGAAHHDYLPPDRLVADHVLAGNRHRTLLACLAAADDGGGESFPLAGLRTRPATGAAVVFDDLLHGGGHETASLHAALPVCRGALWQATLWLREGRYRRA